MSRRAPAPTNRAQAAQAYQQAHAALAGLPNWPRTVEAALRQPYAAATLRLVARGIARGGWDSTLPPTAAHDFKRAAAGEHPDAD